MNTDAINHAIRDCSSSGGGTVVFPPGKYLTASLYLLSNVKLRLDRHAVILGSTNLEDYPLDPTAKPGDPNRFGIITARDTTNVSIIGPGRIEGNALAFVDPTRLKVTEGRDYDKKYTRQGEDYMNPKFGTADGPFEPHHRPGHMVRFIHCTNVFIGGGLRLSDSPAWNILAAQCEDVNITGISIDASASGRRVPNDDGIDLIETHHARISDCHIANGDDCIAVLGGDHIRVDHCTLSSRSTAVRAGFAGTDIRNCEFSHLAIRDSNRGLGVYVRGGGSVEHVRFSDITIDTRLMTGHWWGKAEPIHISAVERDPTSDHLGRIKDICFSNIVAECQGGVVIYGCLQSVVQNIKFDNVKIHVKNGPLQESYGGNFDLRANRDIPTALFAHDIPAFYGRYIDGVNIHGLEVKWDKNLPSFFTSAIQLEDAKNIIIDAFRGGPGPNSPGSAAIALTRGDGVSIRNSVAAIETH